MLAAAFQRRRDLQQVLFGYAALRQYIGHLRLSACNRPGFVQTDNLRIAALLKCLRRFEKNSVSGADTVADHDCHRRRQTQRARAGNHKDADRPGQREAGRPAQQQPDQQGQQGNTDDGGYKITGDGVRQTGHRRLGRRSIAHHLNNLRQRRVLTHAGRLTFQETGLVCRRGTHFVARLFVRGNTLAGQRRLIDRTHSLEHDAVHGNVFAGAHHKHVADSHLIHRNRDFCAVPDQNGRLRRQLHQTLQRISGFALRIGLQHFADRDQRQDHRGGFKIKLMQIMHRGFVSALHLHTRHDKQHHRRIGKSGHGAECNQRVHIRRAVKQTLKTADKEFLVDHHDNAGQQHLQDAHSHGVFREKLRKRKTEHAVPHRDIHQQQKKADRTQKASAQNRGLMVLQRLLLSGYFRRQTAVCAGFCRLLRRGAVTGIFDRRDNLRRIRAALHSHGVGQQADRAGGDALNGRDCFFHAGLTGCAAHTGDCVLIHFIFPSLCVL